MWSSTHLHCWSVFNKAKFLSDWVKFLFSVDLQIFNFYHKIQRFIQFGFLIICYLLLILFTNPQSVSYHQNSFSSTALKFVSCRNISSTFKRPFSLFCLILIDIHVKKVSRCIFSVNFFSRFFFVSFEHHHTKRSTHQLTTSTKNILLLPIRSFFVRHAALALSLCVNHKHKWDWASWLAEFVAMSNFPFSQSKSRPRQLCLCI